MLYLFADDKGDLYRAPLHKAMWYKCATQGTITMKYKSQAHKKNYNRR